MPPGESPRRDCFLNGNRIGFAFFRLTLREGLWRLSSDLIVTSFRLKKGVFVTFFPFSEYSSLERLGVGRGRRRRQKTVLDPPGDAGCSVVRAEV